jgi:hypothetical protein
MSEIDLNSTLFEITEAHKDLIPVLAELGFAGVTNEAMRTTHAKVMTLTSGSEQLGIDPVKIRAALEAAGYTVKT